MKAVVLFKYEESSFQQSRNNQTQTSCWNNDWIIFYYFHEEILIQFCCRCD